MAKNLLSREGLKDKNTGIRVENVNAFEDSELKYDFKVIIDVDRKRGVAIEPEGLSRDEYVKEKRAIGESRTRSSASTGLNTNRYTTIAIASRRRLFIYKSFSALDITFSLCKKIIYGSIKAKV